jgi:hypothetical protein
VPRQNARGFAHEFDSAWRSAKFGVKIRGGLYAAAESVSRVVADANAESSASDDLPSLPPIGHAQHSIAMIAKWAISALLSGAY